MLSGVGRLAVVTRDLTASTLGQNFFFPGLFFNFEYNLESQVKEAKAWIGGKKMIVSSGIGEETYTLPLSFQYLDWMHLGFAYNEIPQQSSNVSLPILKDSTIPTVSPFEVADSSIASTNAGSIMGYVTKRGAWGEAGYRKLASSTTPSMGEFAVDATAKKLIFHSSDAGAPFSYLINKTYSSLPSIGYESEATNFGSLSFIGRGYGPEFPQGIFIYIPQINRIKAPSMKTGDVPEFQMEFACATPAGKRVPHQFFLLQ